MRMLNLAFNEFIDESLALFPHFKLRWRRDSSEYNVIHVSAHGRTYTNVMHFTELGLELRDPCKSVNEGLMPIREYAKSFIMIHSKAASAAQTQARRYK